MASAQQLWPRAVVNFHGTMSKLGRELLSSCSWVQGATDLPPKPCLPVMNWNMNYLKWGDQTSKAWNMKTNFNLQQKLATEAYDARTPEIEQGKSPLTVQTKGCSKGRIWTAALYFGWLPAPLWHNRDAAAACGNSNRCEHIPVCACGSIRLRRPNAQKIQRG